MVTKKRALIIGINYTGTSSALLGCWNDARNARVLAAHHGYTDVRYLTDEPGNALRPTKAAILDGLRWLLSDAASGDSFYVHYSGHGSWVPDRSGDESDRRDECICPLDYQTAGFVLDDELRVQLADRVPAGAKAFVVLDSCHSGTGCDLRYNYRAVSDGLHLFSQEAARRDTKGDVLLLSGCRDNQTSADAYVAGKSQGALSWAYSIAWRPGVALSTALAETQALLRSGGYTQVPQLSSGRPLSRRARFAL